ncbi:transcriptional corepressor SEUSS-like [Populus nigra]|uniref:transcriptional corepressor SEUSS-like n=1 Tax=Populus nigra TaxID=3691 RepID=UPI002B26CC4F|nr:transcriptional corepressor SEUSS-like [Populus nigra]
MKDLIDYSRETGTGPMESLAKFPRRTDSSSGFHSQASQPEGQQQQQQLQTIPQNSNSDRSSAQVPMQITASNGMASVNNSLTTASATTSASTVVGLLHQNSMNSRHQNSMNNASSPYGGNSVQIPSPGYSTSTTIS